MGRVTPVHFSLRLLTMLRKISSIRDPAVYVLWSSLDRLSVCQGGLIQQHKPVSPAVLRACLRHPIVREDVVPFLSPESVGLVSWTDAIRFDYSVMVTSYRSGHVCL